MKYGIAERLRRRACLGPAHADILKEAADGIDLLNTRIITLILSRDKAREERDDLEDVLKGLAHLDSSE